MAPRLVFLMVTLLLGACAAPQPSVYAPLAGRDGYAEESLGKGLHRVYFQGNAATSRERVQNYCLYRAAELTLSLGGERFAVHDKLVERHTQVTRETYGGWGNPYYYGPHGRYYHRPYPPPTYGRESTTFQAILTIEPFSGPAPDGGFQIYDARAVVDQFAPQIVRPRDQPKQ